MPSATSTPTPREIEDTRVIAAQVSAAADRIAAKLDHTLARIDALLDPKREAARREKSSRASKPRGCISIRTVSRGCAYKLSSRAQVRRCRVGAIMVLRYSRMIFNVAMAAAVLVCSHVAIAAPKWFKPSENSWFHDWHEQVAELVKQEAKQPLNRICIVGWQDGGLDSLHAYVYWPQRNFLITWTPTKDDPYSLRDETKRLDLRRDVVATVSQMGSSTYLETRDWVRGIAEHCRRFGSTASVTRRGVVRDGR